MSIYKCNSLYNIKFHRYTFTYTKYIYLPNRKINIWSQYAILKYVGVFVPGSIQFNDGQKWSNSLALASIYTFIQKLDRIYYHKSNIHI